MYKKIAVPVDLTHPELLTRALTTAADLSNLYSAPVVLVAVTSPLPSQVARNSDEFAARLEQFAAQASADHGATFRARAAVSSDPTADLERVLDAEFHRMGADLVVMASHIPGFRDYLFSSRAGFLASHSDLSVFVVR